MQEDTDSQQLHAQHIDRMLHAVQDACYCALLCVCKPLQCLNMHIAHRLTCGGCFFRNKMCNLMHRVTNRDATLDASFDRVVASKFSSVAYFSKPVCP